MGWNVRADPDRFENSANTPMAAELVEQVRPSRGPGLWLY